MTVLEPNDYQEKQNEFSPSSVDLPDGLKIAQRMGLLQQEFPMLCRSGIIAADPLENIASFRNEIHVDYFYLGIFPRSLDRAIGDRTKGRVSIAILQEKDRMKENAKKIRAVWRKYKGLSSILSECMQRAIGASLYDKKRIIDEEFPERAKVLERRGERAKKEKIRTA